MAFLPFLGAIGGGLGTALGGLFGSRAAKSGASASMAGQIDANATNARIADATNAANVQAVRETNATNVGLASSAQEFNAQQAQQQMDFQERMSGSAHQREVADLKAAGLNPILSGTGGAGSSSPSGASASAVMPSIEAPKMQPYQVQNVKSEFANTGRALANLYTSVGSGVGEAAAKLPFANTAFTQASLNNKYLLSQIAALDANSAQSRALQPFWEKIGELSPKAAAAIGDYLLKWNQSVPRGPGHEPPAGLPEIPAPGDVPDVLQGLPQRLGKAVSDLIFSSASNPGGGSTSTSQPNSAKSFDSGRFADSQRSNAGGLSTDVLRRFYANRAARRSQ